MNGNKDAATGCASGEVGQTAAFYASSPIQPVAPAKDAPAIQRHTAMLANGWPLFSFLELGAFPGAVPCARLHARHMLWEWRLTGVSEDVELLVSELVTNAMQASQSLEQTSSIRLWLLSDRQRVLIVVWDSNRRPPVRIDAPDEADGGRGLQIVDAIGERLAWYAPDEIGGKCVWCEVVCPELK